MEMAVNQTLFKTLLYNSLHYPWSFSHKQYLCNRNIIFYITRTSWIILEKITVTEERRGWSNHSRLLILCCVVDTWLAFLSKPSYKNSESFLASPLASSSRMPARLIKHRDRKQDKPSVSEAGGTQTAWLQLHHGLHVSLRSFLNHFI